MLWAREEERVVPIASLTKMMTVLLLMEDIRDRPELSLETALPLPIDADPG